MKCGLGTLKKRQYRCDMMVLIDLLFSYGWLKLSSVFASRALLFQTTTCWQRERRSELEMERGEMLGRLLWPKDRV
jgi:hypothetical protein